MTDCPTLLGILRNAQITLLQAQGTLSVCAQACLADQAQSVQGDFPNQPTTADSRGVWSLRDIEARLAALRAATPQNQTLIAVYMRLDTERQQYDSQIQAVATAQQAYDTALANAQNAGCIGGKGTAQ